MLLNFGERASGEVFTEDHEDEIFWDIEIVFSFIKSNRFVNAAADVVADDGAFINFFRDHNGEALETAGVFTVDEGDSGMADGLAVGVGVADAAAGVEAKLAG